MLTQLIGNFTYPGVFLVLLVSGLGVPIPEELPIAIEIGRASCRERV